MSGNDLVYFSVCLCLKKLISFLVTLDPVWVSNSCKLLVTYSTIKLSVIIRRIVYFCLDIFYIFDVGLSEVLGTVSKFFSGIWICLTFVWLCQTLSDFVWLCLTYLTVFDLVWPCLTLSDLVLSCYVRLDLCLALSKVQSCNTLFNCPIEMFLFLFINDHIFALWAAVFFNVKTENRVWPYVTSILNLKNNLHSLDKLW